jgi:hypothetical protein
MVQGDRGSTPPPLVPIVRGEWYIMPRPVAGYVRPETIACLVCGGPVDVAEKGRIPEGHPACVTLAQDVTRVLASLEAALEGRELAEVRRIRGTLWQPRITGEANTVWNTVDNPATRRRRP